MGTRLDRVYKLGKEKKDYIIATDPHPGMVGKFGGAEIHQLHSRRPNFEKPDYMVFDLDPPEGYDFKELIPIALELRECIETYGYTTFVKTTGGKGLHICCPIEPNWDFHTVFEAAENIAKPFVTQHQQLVTLQIKKEARKGRVLVDIYRIRPGQSIVSPYSLRGRNGAPVSMPITWEELENVKSPQAFNIKNAIDKVLRDGDAWEGFDAYAVALHTKRAKRRREKKIQIRKASSTSPRRNLRPTLRREISIKPPSHQQNSTRKVGTDS